MSTQFGRTAAGSFGGALVLVLTVLGIGLGAMYVEAQTRLEFGGLGQLLAGFGTVLLVVLLGAAAISVGLGVSTLFSGGGGLGRR